jgi:hypothetical protein
VGADHTRRNVRDELPNKRIGGDIMMEVRMIDVRNEDFALDTLTNMGMRDNR